MAVYVDDMKAAFKPKHVPGRTYVMCHMVADTMTELHDMADRIGVARRWFQGDHYDITMSKRRLAVAAGAKELTIHELGVWLLKQRKKDRSKYDGNKARRRQVQEQERLSQSEARDAINRELRSAAKSRRRKRD